MGMGVTGEGSAARNTAAESSPDLKKKAAPVHGFDWALVRGHLGTMGRVSHKPIRPARHYSGLSTVSLGAAAMVTVAGLSYSLIVQSKGRVSISGWWRSLRCCVSS